MSFVEALFEGMPEDQPHRDRTHRSGDRVRQRGRGTEAPLPKPMNLSVLLKGREERSD